MGKLTDRLMHAWNAFRYEEQAGYRNYKDIGISSYNYPDKPRLTRGNDKTIVAAIYNRIANDCAAIDIRNVYVNDEGRYVMDVPGSLNECLINSANIDQTGRQLIHDAVLTMLDEGVVAVVPVQTTTNPNLKEAFKITELRVGKVMEWYPNHVKIRVYDGSRGKHEEITMPKSAVSLMQNPFYVVMNEPNSTLKRLIHKLELLDAIDDQASSGKLDLIVQLPYATRTTLQKEQAANRKKELEAQLTDSKYGIVYTDGTEKITQINRPIENNLMDQIQYLESVMYGQLGISPELMAGTADAEELTLYYTRIIEPIMNTITEEFKRKFLTETARTRGQTVKYFRDPFKLVPVNQMADLSDKLTRNEILTSNEVRQIIGLKPSDDPEADVLRNKNINKNNNDERGTPGPEGAMPADGLPMEIEGEDPVEKQLDELEAQLDAK